LNQMKMLKAVHQDKRDKLDKEQAKRVEALIKKKTQEEERKREGETGFKAEPTLMKDGTKLVRFNYPLHPQRDWSRMNSVIDPIYIYCHFTSLLIPI